MNPILHPLAGLLLLGAAAAACADNDVSAANAVTGAAEAAEAAVVTSVDQTGAGAGSFAAQYLTRGVRDDKGSPAVLAAFDAIRAGGWVAGASSARADGRVIDNGLVALGSYGGYRTAFGVPGARASSYLDLGMHRDLGHATNLTLHAGDGRVAGGGNDAWDWRDLKAGLNRKLDNGWLVALNYTRAYGAAGPNDRSALPAARADGRPAFLNAGHRALVLSMARAF